MHYSRWSIPTCLVATCFGFTAVLAQAQTLTTLLSFDGTTNGKTPVSLLQATDGNLYGIAQAGGAQGAGEIFKITTSGTFTSVVPFKSPAVATSMMQAKDGNFYGTTQADGLNRRGTIFKLTPGGDFTTIYQFSGEDGANPVGPLIQGTDGNFYGATSMGGATLIGYGTVFQMTPAGALTVLHSFSGPDGAEPLAGLIQASDGNLYGTTGYGGTGLCNGFSTIPNGCGTIFKITPAGTLTTIYNFSSTSDSGYPSAPLVQGKDGSLYGTTTGVGTIAYNGTFFKITLAGALTPLHDFTFDSSLLAATTPSSPLVLAPDGNFYLGLNSDLVRITPAGVVSVLYAFCSVAACADGIVGSAVVLATDGNLYGVTRGGGIGGGTVFSGNGTIFKFALNTGGPAISLVANAEGEAPVIAPNTWVEIKGSLLAPAGFSSPDCAPGYCWQAKDFVNNQMPTKLNGVSVTVNGKNAFIYYISPTQINILTPPDALSGPVQVQVTNGGSASAIFNVQSQTISPSFFVFDGSHIAAVHLNGTFVGPTSLYPGRSFPAKPNETIVLYANGFGPTATPVVSGSVTQSGNLSPFPSIKIGGSGATVTFAGLVAPGQYQFNIVVPIDVSDGDQAISTTYNGSPTPPAVIAIQH
jgi:uncharacterized protein (TIGR03437 family)